MDDIKTIYEHLPIDAYTAWRLLAKKYRVFHIQVSKSNTPRFRQMLKRNEHDYDIDGNKTIIHSKINK